MSDSASNPNIEDVLSSIRRLVSEEPGQVRPAPSEEDESAVDALVLTPALRVLDADEEGQVETIEPDAPASDAHSLSEEAEAFLGEIEQSGKETQEEPEETAEDEAHIPPDIPVEYDAQEEWSHPELQAEETPLEASETPTDEPLVLDEAAQDLSLEERIAELEAAIESAPQEWEPDGSEDGTSDETRPLELAFESTGIKEALGTQDEDDVDISGDDISDVTTSDVEPDVVEWQDGPAEPGDDLPPTDDTVDHQEFEAVDEIMSSIADSADEEFVAVEDEQPDVDLEEETSEGGSQTQFADLTDVEEPDEEPSGTDNIVAEDATMLDEEALRDMVSDIVREELQGVLGERITRNVRRLVRREIQRAMTMRDLE